MALSGGKAVLFHRASGRDGPISTLGYYLIVTDTERTEENYIAGLKKSLSQDMQNRIAIKVKQARTDKLVQTCKDQATEMSQFPEQWNLFDKDLVENFDQIIDDANKEEINVAWSNPCIGFMLTSGRCQIVRTPSPVAENLGGYLCKLPDRNTTNQVRRSIIC